VPKKGSTGRVELKPMQERALNVLREDGSELLTRARYQEITGVSRSQAAYDLAELVEAGILVRLGGGRATRYRLTTPARPARPSEPSRPEQHGKRRWTNERIRAELERFCAKRKTWPSPAEFRAAGHSDLYIAASRYGGVGFWASELGFSRPGRTEPPTRSPVRPPSFRWTNERIRAELERFCAKRKTWPSPAEFRAAGHSDLYVAASRYGGVGFWASELGFSRPGRTEPPARSPVRPRRSFRPRPHLRWVAAAAVGAVALLAVGGSSIDSLNGVGHLRSSLPLQTLGPTFVPKRDIQSAASTRPSKPRSAHTVQRAKAKPRVSHARQTQAQAAPAVQTSASQTDLAAVRTPAPTYTPPSEPQSTSQSSSSSTQPTSSSSSRPTPLPPPPGGGGAPRPIPPPHR
jgi:hypothetical protein